jgi:prephenate dehydrogenase
MRVAVIGLGLIGGSLALATRARGFDTDPAVRRAAMERGIDVADDLSSAARNADIVVAAVPPAALGAVLAEAARTCPRAVLADVASSKRDLERLAAALPRQARVVGSHPLAGSTGRGIAAADAALFRGRAWALVPTSRSDTTAMQAVGELARSVGARPIVLSVERHEALMTWLVRAPLAVAAALAWSASTESPEGLTELAGPGFRDATRLAATPAPLAEELLFAAERERLTSVLRAIAATLDDWADELARHDDAPVRAEIEAARDLRAQLDRANEDSAAK